MKGYVYRLFCKDTDVTDCYIGSTKDIEHRMRGHKCDVEYETGNRYHLKKSQFIRSHGGWLNWDHEVLESLDVESQEELRMREQKWIDQTPTATLNGMPAWRSEEDKKELHIEIHARWRDENREKYTEYQAKYQAKYHEANREKILERKAKHYRENKEKMLVKIECNFCGAFVTRSNMKRHQKRPKCLNNRIPLQD